MNEKVARLHLLEDLLGWIGVLILAGIMYFYDLPVLDPAFSIAFTLFILYRVIKNLVSTIQIFLQAKPEEFNMQKFEDDLSGIDGILSFHDLHAWSMDGEYFVITVHIVVRDQVDNQEVVRLKQKVRDLLKVGHVTIEIEYENEDCKLENC